MATFKENKGILALAFFVLAALFVYSSFFSKSVEETAANTVGEDLVKISTNLAKANLDKDLFSQSSYRLLNDFSAPLTFEPTGRSNPFAPIGQ